MVPKWLSVLLSLYFAVEIVSGSSSVNSTITHSTSSNTSTASLSVISSSVSPSLSTARVPSTSQTLPSASPASSNYPNVSSSRPTASVRSSPVSSSSKVPTPAASSSSSSPTSPSASPTPSSASPTGKSTVQVTGSSGPPTQTSTTRAPPTAKGKTIGAMEVLGFCLLAGIAIVLIGFAIYYITCRERKEDDGFNEPMVEARARDPVQPKETEIGITNEALAGDSDNPTKAEVTAPVPEVIPQGPTATNSEVTPDDKESKQTEADDDGAQDSAL